MHTPEGGTHEEGLKTALTRVFNEFGRAKGYLKGNYKTEEVFGLLRRSTGLPVVTTVHSDYRLDYLGRPLSRLTYGTINTIALRRLDYRIGVSDAMTDLLIKRGFDPDRLFTIYNGIDFTPRTPALSREEYFRSVGLEADGDSVVVGQGHRHPGPGLCQGPSGVPQSAAAHRRRR